jgi:hypothetical protein
VAADFLRYYGVPLREAIERWPAQDLTDAVTHLPPDSAMQRAELGDLWDWNHMAANLAELVDLMSYWLQSEYAKWIHDPDDPETQRLERERKRNRVKPPPQPIIPPIAHRPPSVQAAYLEHYRKQLEQTPAAGPVKQLVSSDEFDLILGL